MACPSLLRGVVLRATRLDACGRPVYGDCNQVVSDGFITVSMSAETEEGEDISVTKANGQTCIAESGCEQLSHYTTEIEFCEVDPDLVQIMNPSFEIYRDFDGNPIGWDDSVELKCDTGYALEVWSNVYAGQADACSGAGSQGQWGYLLLPWVVGGAPGDLEIGNDAVSFTFNGRTKVGSGWRKGPYNVQAGPGGIPSPMLKPIGPKVPRRFFVTTIRPPEAECGCQPVDRPTPDPADLYITGIANEAPRTVRFRADNHGFGPLMVDFGDGSPAQEVADGAWVTHVYTGDGQFTIKACDKETPVICAERPVTIPLPADEPTLSLETKNPSNPYEVTATVGMPSQSDGTALIDWGDGTEPEEIAAGDDGTVSVLHVYTVPSVYTVMVRRGDIDTYRTREAILVPGQGGGGDVPQVTAEADPADASGRTVLLHIDNTGGTVPAPGPEADAAVDPADPSGKTVKVTVDNTTTA
ncbi:hypothetical protein [Streptomyces sp. NPDC048644]|uniref:hypothetical protein n=1 Tax=Streptomyces sp. NPDC048644 TaxID=3365582 RepID=UPI003713A2D0